MLVVESFRKNLASNSNSKSDYRTYPIKGMGEKVMVVV